MVKQEKRTAMRSDIAISVRNLTKTYRLFGHPGDRIKQFFSLGLKQYHREFTALKDVSFDIKKGETVGIIGRNGSGKSTLLQLVCGILKPTSGAVVVQGRVSALLELGAGFNPEFTGRENVYFQGAVLGFSKDDISRRFDAIATFADIGEFMEQPVRTYSSGMFLRLAFSTAIHTDPDILVVDEALAVGDIDFQAKCMTVFRRFRQRGVTVLFVSHDMNAVRSLCSRGIYLDCGDLIEIGSASEIAERYLREIRSAASSSRQAYAPGEVGCQDDSQFAERVKAFRQGTGESRVTAVELLDTEGRVCSNANFGEAVRVRLHMRFFEACEVAVSYYLRDDKHLIIAGSTTVLEGYGLVKGGAGDRKIVEFTTRLPLVDGTYNILAVLSVPVVPNRSARFVDFVENALVFVVQERVPVKLWSKVYVENSVAVMDA
ncbi:ABC transporter ATP-binding protein [Propionivibrio sp.]|uniref:ABC transporter ATP-binding protein n=1 Tax=Propionivibrio sp. TaxID=2212460 RepID=UPI0025F9E2B3|nr:ABC transporter ATP-binding protein [Propionivibrio sp.]